MEIKVTHLEQVRFRIQARSHSVICDQPLGNGGADTAMTPPELMLASLGSCAAFYAVEYLKARNLLRDKPVEVSVSAEKLFKPARLGNFRVRVDCPVLLTPQQNEGLMRSVSNCLVHNTLLTPPQIDIELHQPEHALLHD
jgi:putative redox protein